MIVLLSSEDFLKHVVNAGDQHWIYAIDTDFIWMTKEEEELVKEIKHTNRSNCSLEPLLISLNMGVSVHCIGSI